MNQLSIQDLEVVYDTLAMTLDGMDAQKHNLFLTKLTLLLANQVANLNVIQQAIDVAAIMES